MGDEAKGGANGGGSGGGTRRRDGPGAASGGAAAAVNDPRRSAPATLRNRDAILAVLRRHLPAAGTVLEVASGTGEHAIHFAAALPGLSFQPSDPDPAARASTDAWVRAAGLGNIRPTLALDAAAAETWPVERADAVLCINMIHIAPWAAALGLVRGAARLLPPGGPLVLYGPFRRGGTHTAPSNAAFDAGLRAQDPAWGVRDLEAVAAAAAAAGFDPAPVIEAMPANNLTLVLRRRPRPPAA
jgi:SAM-dependent methyltransferase